MATTKRKKSLTKVPTVSQQEATKQDTSTVLNPLSTKYPYLDENELQTLSVLSIGNTDIHQLSMARTLRGIERKQAEHGDSIIKIGKVVGDYSVHEPLPYFSVSLIRS